MFFDKNLLTNVNTGVILTSSKSTVINTLNFLEVTKMKGISKIALVVSKIIEVLYWVAAAATLVMFILSITAGEWLSGILSQGVTKFGWIVETRGFEINVAAGGAVNMTAVALFFITAAVLLSLTAMIFRNIYLIIKTSRGGTWFSKGSTPFQKDIVRMLREIGIFSISVPIVGIIMSVVSRLVLGAEFAEISMQLDGFVTGILALFLAQIFDYGAKLESDVDGLL